MMMVVGSSFIIKWCRLAVSLLLLLLVAFSALGNPTDTVRPIAKFKAKFPDVDSFMVKDFVIQGNQKTKRFVVFREIPLEKGDTIPMDKLRKTLKKSEKKLMNTSLFNKVRMAPIWLEKGRARIIIAVEERWYTFPKPIFELADRNFNTWWVQKDAKLDRVSYGLRLYQENVRGRNEQLELLTQLGFNQKYGIFYKIPYLKKHKRTGLRLGVRYSRSHKTPYSAEGQNLNFYNDDEEYINKQFTSQVKLIHRPTIDIGHRAEVEFHSNWVAKPIILRNAEYYRGERQVQRFLRLRYQYQEDYRDRVNYPTDGYLLQLEALQWGVGAFEGPSTTAINGIYNHYEKLSDRWTIANAGAARYSLPGDQPFSIEQGFGYGKIFVRGYEYYVINGQDYVLNRNDLRYRIFSTKINLPEIIPDQFQTVPLDVRLKAFGDHGVVLDHYQQQEAPNLANRYLTGFGLGMDVTTYYDVTFRLEYAMNNRSESDLFLHFGLPF